MQKNKLIILFFTVYCFHAISSSRHNENDNLQATAKHAHLLYIQKNFIDAFTHGIKKKQRSILPIFFKTFIDQYEEEPFLKKLMKENTYLAIKNMQYNKRNTYFKAAKDLFTMRYNLANDLLREKDSSNNQISKFIKILLLQEFEQHFKINKIKRSLNKKDCFYNGFGKNVS